MTDLCAGILHAEIDGSHARCLLPREHPVHITAWDLRLTKGRHRFVREQDTCAVCDEEVTK